jgi:predicted  nucleic acid-binding Zn-ribbon protein
MDERERTIRQASEHVAHMRKRLDDGRAEIERQQASISDTREHMSGIERWLDESRRHANDDAA